MNDEPIDDDVEEPLARALRAVAPPPARSDARRALLAEFERSMASRRAPTRRLPPLQLVGLAAAAAGLVLAALLLLRSTGPVESRDAVAEREFANLQARLDRIAESVARIERPAVTALRSEEGKRLEAALDVSGRDPGLLRLVAASRIEQADKAEAEDRYRALIHDYANSPASEVAAERLARLAEGENAR
jgi:hypothetical protein